MAELSVLWALLGLGMSICITFCKSETPLEKGEMQTFYDGASTRRLVTNKNPVFLDNVERRVGRMYLNTSWMTYEGCLFSKEPIGQTITLKDNSPALCSLFCAEYQYIGVKENNCTCLNTTDIKFDDFQEADIRTPDCTASSCTSKDPWGTCGSSHKQYYSIYEHNLEPNYSQDTFNWGTKNSPVDDASIGQSCILAEKKCIERRSTFCENQQNADSNVNICRTTNNHLKCPIIEAVHNDSSSSYWMTFYRYTVPVWLDIPNDSCVFIKNSNGVKLRNRPCNSSQLNICYTVLDGIVSLFFQKQNCDTEKTTSGDISTITDYIKKEESSKNYEQQFPTESGNNATTANSTISEENDNEIFLIQMGFIFGSCAMVMLIAVLACCIRITKRGTYTFPISRSEENIVMATEGPPQHTIPTAALSENYSEPKDKASSSSEMEGPRFCATTPCQNTNCQKTENGEYHHLDFTLRSETSPRFADNNEYDHVRANVISVFEQPWDTATSKVNKLFSQISKSVVLKGQNIRKSLIKRRESRSGSPKLKCRASDYCDAWKTQLNKQQFVFDSDVDDQSNTSIDIATTTVDLNRDGPQLRKTDSAFPVLPYSERINVKSTHIYDEPDERRMSLRERLLHMISIRPLKMPFGIELDLRASRSKSKIYSLATSIEEIDESVA